MYTNGGQLGFISDIISIGRDVWDAGGNIFGGGGGGATADQYYPAVKAGQLLCPGPYDIGRVAAVLSRRPDLMAAVDRELARDRAWGAGMYGPLTTPTQKASALVNWAHGGRDCSVVSGERDKVDLVERILAAEVTGPTVDLGLTYGPGGASVAGLPSWLPLLGAAAVAAYLLKR